MSSCPTPSTDHLVPEFPFDEPWYENEMLSTLALERFDRGVFGDGYYFRKYHLRPVKNWGSCTKGSSSYSNEWLDKHRRDREYYPYKWVDFDFLSADGTEIPARMEYNPGVPDAKPPTGAWGRVWERLSGRLLLTIEYTGVELQTRITLVGSVDYVSHGDIIDTAMFRRAAFLGSGNVYVTGHELELLTSVAMVMGNARNDIFVEHIPRSIRDQIQSMAIEVAISTNALLLEIEDTILPILVAYCPADIPTDATSWHFRIAERIRNSNSDYKLFEKTAAEICDPLQYLSTRSGSRGERIKKVRFDYVDTVTDSPDIAKNLTAIYQAYHAGWSGGEWGEKERREFAGAVCKADGRILASLYSKEGLCRKVTHNYHVNNPTMVYLYREGTGAPIAHQDWNLVRNLPAKGIIPINTWRILDANPHENSSLAILPELVVKDGLITDCGPVVARIGVDCSQMPFAFIFQTIGATHVAVHTERSAQYRRSVESRSFMMSTETHSGIIQVVQSDKHVSGLSKLPKQAVLLWEEFKGADIFFTAYSDFEITVDKVKTKPAFRPGWQSLNSTVVRILKAAAPDILDSWLYMFSDPQLIFDYRSGLRLGETTSKKWYSPHYPNGDILKFHQSVSRISLEY